MSNNESGKLFRLDDYRKKDPVDRKGLDVTDDGYFMYPKKHEKVFSLEEALAFAEEVISTLEQEGALVRNYAEHETARILSRGTLEIPKEILFRDYTEEAQKSLEQMKSDSIHCSTESIVAILTQHKKYPRHFVGTYIYAIACELRRRLKKDTSEQTEVSS